MDCRHGAARQGTVRVGLVALGLSLGVLGIAAVGQAQDAAFNEAQVFFQLNDTDGDIGILAALDGAAWRWLTIEAPDTGSTVLDVSAKGSLRVIGLTNVSFESREPKFEFVPPEMFLERFPEGVYSVAGQTLGGQQIQSDSELSHALPAAPSNMRVNGSPLPVDCVEERAPAIMVGDRVLLEWDPVETTHPDIGSPRGSPDIEIVEYRVFVDHGDFGIAYDNDDTEVTSLALPAELFSPDEAIVVEILARAASENRTTSKSCFRLR